MKKAQVLPLCLVVAVGLGGGAVGLAVAAEATTPRGEVSGLKADTLGDRARAQAARDAKDSQIAQRRMSTLRATSRLFRELAAEPPPRDLTPEQQKAVIEYSTWLRTTAAKLATLADRWQAALEQGPPAPGASSGAPGRVSGKGVAHLEEQKVRTSAFQEMQMSFNLEYLRLQEQMQKENRQFTMVSNIMKTKHDTVKNSISNIR